MKNQNKNISFHLNAIVALEMISKNGLKKMQELGSEKRATKYFLTKPT